MGTYFSIPYVPKKAAVVEVSAVKTETVASQTLVAADLKTEAEPKVRIPLTDMEAAITKEVDQLLDQKREPDESKKAIQGLLVIVEDMQKIIELKEEPKEEVKEEPKVEEPKEEVKEKPKVEEKTEVKEEPKAEVKEEKKEEPKEEPKDKKSEYKEVLKDLLRETQSKKEPTLPVIMEEPAVEHKLSIPSSSPVDPPHTSEKKKKKNKK